MEKTKRPLHNKGRCAHCGSDKVLYEEDIVQWADLTYIDGVGFEADAYTLRTCDDGTDARLVCDDCGGESDLGDHFEWVS